jgi:hypothetical protein
MSVTVSHNAGFFSCCSIKLHEIVKHINSHNNLPEHVDSSHQFAWYKLHHPGDITYDYFEHYDNVHNICYVANIDYLDHYQFNDYSTLNYEQITPIVKKYFSPSFEINNIIANVANKYNIDYDNTCVLFYRGNDKNGETPICEYSEYIDYAKLIIVQNPTIKFLLQSDETEFLVFMLDMFPDNSFYFKDEIRHMKKNVHNTVDHTMRDNIDIFSKNYLAITIIMSKCKNIICSTGNCSIWIMLYRGNNANVCQNLNGAWITNVN